ncbi:MAG TPA: twin-arginine translocase TatA/TatE family subunit [Candidatus Dormibacteraeota bacterium]|nr:twin-arginine translocase TatA/TatE family subunit [Candidatus Dormibacteraeota bacterium]
MPIHPLWLVVILVIVLIIFGPGRLPELGGAVGKAMREFRKATNELTSEVTSASQAKPEPAAVSPAAVSPAAASPTATSESAAKGSTSEANSQNS